MIKKILLFMLLCSVAYATPSTTISTPNSFTPNTTIQSSQVNSNFSEVQNKYNNHSHTDITQVGAVTSGTWLGTAIGTQYGGTGNDWSTEAAGYLPYFSAAGVLSTLPVGTAGTYLTTNGAGVAPSWTAGGSARNAVTRGFEISATAAATHVVVSGGSLFHNSSGVDVATNTILNFTDATSWSSGAVVNYGADGWNYIGVSSTASTTTKGVYLLGANPPTASDVNGHSSGTNLYSYDGTKWYRVVCAFRVDSAGSDAVKFAENQIKDYVNMDTSSAYTFNNVAFTDVDISGVVPKISQLVNLTVDTNNQEPVVLRQNGSTDTEANSFLTSAYRAGSSIQPIDENQIFEAKNGGGANSSARIQGYWLAIR